MIWVNDEGILLDLPLNPTATLLASQYGCCQVLFGPAVLTGGPDRRGATGSLEPDVARRLQGLLGQIATDIH